MAWTWQPPQDIRPARLLPTAGGAVVDVGHGVIALDTATGEQTWHYLLPGTEMTANVTPDWETTVLSHETESGSAVVALDSITGKRRGHAVLPTSQEADIGLLTANARIPLEQTDTGWQPTARSLAADAHLWSTALSSHCLVQQQTRSWIRTYDDRIVVAQPCHPELPRTPAEELAELSGGTNRLTAYDADTGEEEWTHEWEAEEPFGAFPELAHPRADTRLDAPSFTASRSVVAAKHRTDGHTSTWCWTWGAAYATRSLWSSRDTTTVSTSPPTGSRPCATIRRQTRSSTSSSCTSPAKNLKWSPGCATQRDWTILAATHGWH